jgi:hypothetical protein
LFYSKSGKRNYLPNKLKQYQVPTLLRECVMENYDLKDLYPVLTEVTYIYCVIYIFCNVLHVSHTCIYIYIYIQKGVKLLCIKGHTVSIIVCTLWKYIQPQSKNDFTFIPGVFIPIAQWSSHCQKDLAC